MKRRPASRMGASHLGAALVGVVVLLAGTRAKAEGGADAGVPERWIVPAGRESEVLALLSPFALLKPTASGLLLKDASVDATTVTVTVVEREGAEPIGRLTLRRVSEASLEVAGEGVPDALVAEVRAAVEAKPREAWPWVRSKTGVVREGSSGRTLRDFGTVWPLLLPGLLVLVLLVSTVLATIAERRAGSGFARADVFGVVVLTVAGGAVRLAISPRSFMHEYYHVVDFMNDALYRDDGFFTYGGGGPVLFRVARFLFGGVEEAVFGTNLVLSMLTVPAAGAFAAFVAGGPAGVLAAGLVAFAPMHLRFSGSEELTVGGTLFATWALAALAAWWRSGRAWWLGSAVAALALALHTRPELLAFPAFAAGVVLVDRSAWRRLGSRAFVAGAGALVLLAWPRVAFLRAAPKSETSLRAAFEFFPSRFALWEFDALPVVWLALAVAGLVGWWRAKRPGVAAWTVAAAVGLALLGLTFFQNPAPYSWRVQLVALPFLALLASGALEWVAAEGVRRRWAAWGLVLLAAGLLVRHRAAVTTLGDQQLEFAFVKSTVVPALPSSAKLLAVREQGGRSLDAFPIFLLEEAKKAVDVVDLDALAANGGWPSPEGPDAPYYFEGMPCYFSFRDEPLPIPRHPRCAEVRRRYALEPVAVTTIDAPPYSPLNYAPGPWTVGLYRLKPHVPEP